MHGPRRVDSADRAIFLTTFGTSLGSDDYDARSDLDGDGSVSFVGDQHWLQSDREQQTAEPVPEPASLLLLIIGLGCLGAIAAGVSRRDRRRGRRGASGGQAA